MTIIAVMTKRIYVEVKLDKETLKVAKMQALVEGISQAELISKAVKIYLHELLDKHDSQE